MTHISKIPFYNERTAEMMADYLVGQGHTVFQMYQFRDGEKAHSLRLLELANPPPNAKVLSLGCGIGGMERYWQEARPDLQFTLVNLSHAQLNRCLCEGRKVYADAEDYYEPGYDLVVLCYMLGHVDHKKVMRNALAMGDKVLVNDVFNASLDFEERFSYHPPRIDEMCGRKIGDDLHLIPYLKHLPIDGNVIPAVFLI